MGSTGRRKVPGRPTRASAVEAPVNPNVSLEKSMKRTLILGTLVCMLALVPAVSAEKPAEPRVLFVGNSLTYYNDVSELVRQLSRSDNTTFGVIRPLGSGLTFGVYHRNCIVAVPALKV